jgi:two-component system LytT family response regulator
MSRPLRVIVVDDEPLARSGIADLVQRDADLEVVAQCGDGQSAVDQIRALSPDLVLLDIQMPEMDGFEVIQQIGVDRMPAVIFITAYDQFALRAFEVHALDYLLKPFDDERFTAALARTKRALQDTAVGQLSQRLLGLLELRGGHEKSPAPAGGESPGQPYLTRLVVKNAGRVVFVRVDEIDWIEAADYYVRLHVARKTHLLRETMSALEDQLDPTRFFRVHRSAIVNLDRLVEIQPYFHGEHILVLQDGSKLKLSRSRKEKLEAVLRQSI